MLIVAIVAPIGMHVGVHAVETVQAETKTNPVKATKESTKVIVDVINQNRVQKAREAYTLRARWAPFIKYGLYSAGLGITLASFFSYYLTASKLTCSETTHLRELLAQQPIKKEVWDLRSSVSSFGMVLATGLAQSLGSMTIHYGTSCIAGKLDWYIDNHTGFKENVGNLIRAFQFYAIFKEIFPTLAQLFMHDIEKILGYLEYCKAIAFTKKSLTVKTALQSHINFIEEHANAFAQAVNNNQPVEQLIASITLLEGDITHATKFVGVYS